MNILFETSPDGELYIQWLLSGLVWTLTLALSAAFFSFCLGVLVGITRNSRNKPMAIAGRAYVQVFRNIPLIVQMFLWYFVLPELLPVAWGDAIKQLAQPWGSFWPALICLSLYSSSRVAEQVKAGLAALPVGQREACEALGLTTFQRYKKVLIPQTLRIIIPTLTSEAMGVFKNTSVALTIGLVELTAQAQQINEFTYKTFQAFSAATVCYILLALSVYTVMTLIERRMHVPGLTPVHQLNVKKG
ncbi:amino acid ABC transporter permease [Pseudomonas sp. WHRI 8519]|uniref:amino acid ABC transporter permease n=1 Tax=Pseudomonas sp. WHRI 8519 TaxID=3162567 RepID=UPI0032EAA0E1